MLVRIINGGYGHREKNSKVVELKDCNSKPFEVNDAEAKRIIALGIAEAVTVEVAAEKEPEVVYGNIDREMLESMDYQSLRQLAKDLDLDSKGTKEEIIDRIANEKVEIPNEPDAEVEDDEEQPPVLDAAGHGLPYHLYRSGTVQRSFGTALGHQRTPHPHR